MPALEVDGFMKQPVSKKRMYMHWFGVVCKIPLKMDGFMKRPIWNEYKSLYISLKGTFHKMPH